MFIESATPAISLITKEWGPATFTTIDASNDRPSARSTPATRPSSIRIPLTSALNRNSPPLASAARCKLWEASWGSVTYPGRRGEDDASDLVVRLLPESVVFGSLGRGMFAHIDAGDSLGELGGVPDLIGDADLVEEREHLLGIALVVAEVNAATLDEFGRAPLVLDLEVVVPILPVVEPLERHGDSRPGRVVGPHDGAGVGGRSVTGGGELVDVEGLVAGLRQLEAEVGADNPGTDDDGVVTRAVRSWAKPTETRMAVPAGS